MRDYYRKLQRSRLLLVGNCEWQGRVRSGTARNCRKGGQVITEQFCHKMNVARLLYLKFGRSGEQTQLEKV